MNKKELKDKIVEVQKLPEEVVEKFLRTKGELKVTPKIKSILDEIKKN